MPYELLSAAFSNPLGEGRYFWNELTNYKEGVILNH
jgi:hypothetical protein